MDFEFSGEKFRALVLHLADCSRDDKRFGATKLNKLLFYADTESYLALGAPITGATYQRLREGPAPREIMAERGILLTSGDATMESRPFHGMTQERLVPTGTVDVTLLNPEEIAIADAVVAKFWNYPASRISGYSHRECGMGKQ